LLVAASGTVAGSQSIQITVPAGQTSFNYFLQALGGSGTGAFNVSVPGYTPFSGSVALTNSALVLGATGTDLPFATAQSPTSVILNVYTAQLDEANAYVQKQQLRGGLSLTGVTLTSSVAAIPVDSPVTLVGGATAPVNVIVHANTAGQANITINQPSGFTASTNPLFVGQPSSTFQLTVN
jgi:hypothetical protein